MPTVRNRRCVEPPAETSRSFQTSVSVGEKLKDYIRSGAGVEQFADGPGKQIAWQWANGGKTFWQSMKEDPEAGDDFHQLMASRRQGRLAPSWFNIYPAESRLAVMNGNIKTEPENVLLIDIGGGRGHDVADFRAAYRHLPGKCILQDLPETIAEARKAPPGDVELMEHDFFTPQPVKGKPLCSLLARPFSTRL